MCRNMLFCLLYSVLRAGHVRFRFPMLAESPVISGQNVPRQAPAMGLGREPSILAARGWRGRVSARATPGASGRQQLCLGGGPSGADSREQSAKALSELVLPRFIRRIFFFCVQKPRLRPAHAPAPRPSRGYVGELGYVAGRRLASGGGGWLLAQGRRRVGPAIRQQEEGEGEPAASRLGVSQQGVQERTAGFVMARRFVDM